MIVETRLTRVSITVQVTTMLYLSTFSAVGQSAPPGTSRPIMVADGIEMTRLADPDYLVGGASNAHVAHFSPDGRRFFVVLRKGNLTYNINEFLLYAFDAGNVFDLTKPRPLVTLSSASNRDAIANAKWLRDNQTIAFLGGNTGEAPQAYLVNVRTKRLKRLTNEPAGIAAFDITWDGRKIMYITNTARPKPNRSEQVRREEIVIEGQNLSSILAGNYASYDEKQVFLQDQDRSAVLVPMSDYVLSGEVLLSPNGQYGLVGILVRDIPSEWQQYGGFVHDMLAVSVPKGTILPLREYVLIDNKERIAKLLVNAPSAGKPTWAEDSQSVFLKTYLPLSVSDSAERVSPENNVSDVEVKLRSREFRKISESERPKEAKPVVEVEVSVEQDLNTPQRIFVADPITRRKTLLFDLGAQFRNVNLGRAETIEWEVRDGLKVRGGLYFPLDYEAGKRYPLVIQTHGFVPTEFSTDGAREWGSGFAARLLAAKGFLVLQAFGFISRDDHDHYNDRMQFGSSPEQAGRNINVAAIESAIDYLDKQKMIDRRRLGVVGFSRTVCVVAYVLTHSKYQFASASLVDGIDCGYFQEMAFPSIAWDVDNINGRAQPFGEGLQKWLSESPGFSLDKVRTPVRLLALGPNAVLEAWEWYVGLARQKKPVDFVLLPDATHLVVKPKERLTAQQGLVDWFCFWLKEEEDSDPAKLQQYSRWRAMRRERVMDAAALPPRRADEK